MAYKQAFNAMFTGSFTKHVASHKFLGGGGFGGNRMWMEGNWNKFEGTVAYVTEHSVMSLAVKNSKWCLL